MNRSLLIIALCTTLLCSKAIAQEAVSNKDYLLHHPNRMEWEAGGFYEGTFEDGTPFQMNLVYPIPENICQHIKEKEQRDRCDLLESSSYWYPRKFDGDYLGLREDFSKDDRFTLTTLPSSTARETFTGSLSQDRLRAEGQWTKADSKKSLHFAMNRVFAYKAAVVYFPVKPPAYDDIRSAKLYSFFPIINNPVIDAAIGKDFSSCHGSKSGEPEDYRWECLDSIHVRWQSKRKDLVLLQADHSDYSGGAHGDFAQANHFFKVTRDSAEEMKISHFIDQSESCDKKITDKITAALRKNYADDNIDANATGDIGDTEFIPTPLGIGFTYSLYQLGGYPLGLPGVFLTRSQLGQCLKSLPSY